MNRLMGKNAVITGGSRGIGKAIASLFVQEGASVALLGMDEKRGDLTAGELSQYCSKKGQTVQFHRVDVSQKEQVDLFSQKILVEWDNRVDILVNNAGITKDSLLMRMKEEDWDQVIQINLKSIYNVTHAFVRNMLKKTWGRIINITSIVGIKGNAGQTNYAASKAGIIGFTSSLAKEIAGRNVTVNCIAPGGIATDMLHHLTDAQKKKLLDQVPLGRFGTPEEVAFPALFLASDDSSYMTGQVLVIDGGMSA